MPYGVADDDCGTLDHEIRVFRDGAWCYCGISADGPPSNSELAQTQGPGVYQLAPIDPLTRKPVPGKVETRTILAPRSADSPAVMQSAPPAPQVVDFTAQMLMQQQQETAEARRQLERDLTQQRVEQERRLQAQLDREEQRRREEREREREDRKAQRDLMFSALQALPTMLTSAIATLKQAATPPPPPASGADVALELLRAELERERKKDPMLDMLRVKMMREMMRDIADDKSADEDSGVWGEALREALPALASRFTGQPPPAAAAATSPLMDPRSLAGEIMRVGPDRAIATLRQLAQEQPDLAAAILEQLQPSGSHRLRAVE